MARSNHSEEEEVYSSQSHAQSHVSDVLIDYQIDPITATKDEVTGWMRQRRQAYEENDIGEGDLHEMFCEDFFDWKKETFSKASPIVNRELRTSLRDKGVWITKDNQPICSNLAKALQAWIPWPEKEKKPMKFIAYELYKVFGPTS